MKWSQSFGPVLGLSLVWGWVQGTAFAQKIPPVHGRTFSGAPVDLPQASAGKTTVLVIGFSQDSRSAVTAWGKKLAADYYDSPSVLYYEMPMLASVPKFLRGFVAGKIKSSVSERGRVHFIPLEDNEAEWKRISHYEAAGDAYVLVLDQQGSVRWQTHGQATDAAYTGMKQQIEAGKPATPTSAAR